MKYADINRRYTEIIAMYIGRGYTFNTASMGGSQGETCKIDLTDDTEIIRVLVGTFHDCSGNLKGIQITVGKSTDKVAQPHDDSSWNTVWNDHLEVLSTERFYKIGDDRRHGTFYGSEAEAKAVVTIRQSRYFLRESSRKTENITDKAIEIAKRVIRREFGVKRICENDIMVSKYNGVYTIGYKNKTYRLH